MEFMDGKEFGWSSPRRQHCELIYKKLSLQLVRASAWPGKNPFY